MQPSPFRSFLLVAVLLAPSPALAATPCLSGTPGEIAADRSAIAATRLAIEQACPCAAFDGQSGRRHPDWVRCAKAAVDANIAAGSLRTACKGKLRRDLALTNCGFPAAEARRPCLGRTPSSGRIVCKIRRTSPADACPSLTTPSLVQQSCPGFAWCIDAGDVDGDLLLSAPGDDGSCAPLPTATPPPGPTPTPPPTGTPAPARITLSRDVYGFAHVEAGDDFGAGYGVGVAQVDDYGLDLQLFWALLSPDLETALTEQAIGFARSGQVVPTLQFDPATGFPLPASRRQARPTTLEDIYLTLAYLNFYEMLDEAFVRLAEQPSLAEYLEGYAAGVNARIAQKRDLYLARAQVDARMHYLVSRGLHLRQVTAKDAIRGSASGSIALSRASVQGWVDGIDGVPTTTDPVSSPAVARRSNGHEARLGRVFDGHAPARPIHTASNGFGFSGAFTTSGHPIVMTDPHIPSYGAWLSSASSVVVKSPDIVIDAAIPAGSATPAIGHALHPRSGSAIAVNGTANAQTPSSAWFAPVPPTLDTCATSESDGAPRPFTVRMLRDVTLRDTPMHGRLIAQKRVRFGPGDVREVGFLYRSTKDHKFSSVESLWPLFHARSVSEVHAALDRHQHPAWNMTIGISTPDRPSTVLYINNQVAPRRNPNPDGDPATIHDWNGLVDALDPAYQWLGGYHLASELPQIVAEEHGRPFLHCHNCQPEMVTGQMPSHPYLIGGWAGFTNPRQVAGDRHYAEAVSGGRKLSLEDASALANHLGDILLEEAFTKLRATLDSHPEVLAADDRADAEAEIELWRAGPLVGSLSNPRVARALYWTELMQAPAVRAQWSSSAHSKDLERIVLGEMHPVDVVAFDVHAPLSETNARIALSGLAQVHRTFASVYGSDTRTWGEIQRYRPDIFGQPFATGPLDLPIAGTGQSLRSLMGSVEGGPGGRVHVTRGGQTYVQVIEVGVRSVLQKSVAGTTDPSLPYASRMSELYAAGVFTPTGVRDVEMPAGRVVSTETLEVTGPRGAG